MSSSLPMSCIPGSKMHFLSLDLQRKKRAFFIIIKIIGAFPPADSAYTKLCFAP
jgi:hypothetical protein